MELAHFTDMQDEFMRRVSEGTIEHHYFGILRFTPWRIELGNLGVKRWSVVFQKGSYE